MNKIFLVIMGTIGILGAIAIIVMIKSSNQLPNSETYTVLDIEENLILNLSNGKERNKIKLCGVDIPNSQQSAAKDLVVKELETVDNIVSVTFIGDKAEVFLSDITPEKMLSEQLLLNGLAKLKQDNCPNQNSLESAETIAKQNKIGVWK
jgi:endonuclease YncB( thermonuclease family)